MHSEAVASFSFSAQVYGLNVVVVPMCFLHSLQRKDSFQCMTGL